MYNWIQQFWTHTNERVWWTRIYTKRLHDTNFDLRIEIKDEKKYFLSYARDDNATYTGDMEQDVFVEIATFFVWV